MSSIETGTVTVDGVSTFFRRVPGEGPPTLFVHGVPVHSEDWMPFLERMPGPALALDLPGFGRSERPGPAGFDYSMYGQAAFVKRFLQRMAVDEYSLVVHDWGGLALITAQEEPARVKRLVLMNCVPFLPGYRWHRTARIWQTRGLGELSTRLWTRRLAALALRESRGDWSPHDPAFVDMIWDHLDKGTFAAILGLYRSAPPERLEAAGRGLGRIEAPALVVWAGRDRYISPRFGRDYADRLPNAQLLELPRAGHWPWIDAPEVVGRVIGFLEDKESQPA